MDHAPEHVAILEMWVPGIIMDEMGWDDRDEMGWDGLNFTRVSFWGQRGWVRLRRLSDRVVSVPRDRGDGLIPYLWCGRSCTGGLFIFIASVELVSCGDVAPHVINRARNAMAPSLLGGLSLPSRAHTSAEAQG